MHLVRDSLKHGCVMETAGCGWPTGEGKGECLEVSDEKGKPQVCLVLEEYGMLKWDDLFHVSHLF